MSFFFFRTLSAHTPMAFVSLNILFSFLVQLHIFLTSASSAFFFNAANEVPWGTAIL
jgi:hypothetical protein